MRPDDFALFPKTTFFGEKDKAKTRQMASDIPDVSSFNTRKRTNPDGSETMLRTKGGMPRVTVESEEKKTRIELPVCAAIPVCAEAPYGFAYSSGVVSAFTTSGEPKPASALLSISQTATRVYWNERKVKTAAKTAHPGNRIWFDSRDSASRAFAGVVSWWYPLNHLLDQVAYDPDPASVWLGEQCPVMGAIPLHNGDEISFLDSSRRGVVFIDGLAAHDFGAYVLAAAVERRGGAKLLHAVTADSLDLYATMVGSQPQIGTNINTLKLRTYDTQTGVTTEVLLSVNIFGQVTYLGFVYPAPQFSPDGAKLLFAKMHSAFTYLEIVELDIVGGTTTFIAKQNEYVPRYSTYISSRILALWYAPDGERRYLKMLGEAYAQYPEAEYWYGPLSGGTLLYSIPATSPALTAFVPLASDGFGGIFAGKGTILNVGSTDLFSHWDGDPLFGAYSATRGEVPASVFMEVNGVLTETALSGVRIPICTVVSNTFGLPRPSQVWQAWRFGFAPLPPYGSTYFGKTARMRIAFATNPERKKFLAAVGTLDGTYYAYFNIDGPPTTPEIIMTAQSAAYVGVLDESVTTPVFSSYRTENQWSGTDNLFNSPVFFARESSLFKEIDAI